MAIFVPTAVIPSGGILADAVNGWLHGLTSTGNTQTDINLLTDSFGDVFYLSSNHSDHLRCGSGDDYVWSDISGTDSFFDTIDGGDGNDFIEGGHGPDSIDGGDGSDTLVYSRSLESVSVNLETHAVSGGATGDAFANMENVIGSNFGDVLTGDAANNTLGGLNGRDTLSGGLGSNTLAGGRGNDIYILGDGADTIIEKPGEGYDTVRFTNASTINFQTGSGGAGDPSNDLWSEGNIERFEGSGGNDTIILAIAGTISHDLYGGNGSDILGSGAVADTLDGGAGNDFLYARDGNDKLVGGTGKDELYGDAGADLLIGGTGNDSLYGGSGIDTASFADHYGNASGGWYISLANQTASTSSSTTTILITETDVLSDIENVIGSSGSDTIEAFGGNVINGGAGRDTLILAPTWSFGTFGFAENDIVDLQAGTSFGTGNSTTFTNIEVIHTNIGDDTVSGSSGVDTVFGDAGADTISGLNGADKLNGGEGADTLTGGLGNDTFVYSGLTEGGDVITDFTNAAGNNDRFSFERADVGNLGSAADGSGNLKAIHFQASSADTAQTEDTRFIYDTDDGVLRFDADGTGIAAAVIIATLTNIPVLTAADFLLV